jgi:hypothetical protein
MEGDVCATRVGSSVDDESLINCGCSGRAYRAWEKPAVTEAVSVATSLLSQSRLPLEQ